MGWTARLKGEGVCEKRRESDRERGKKLSGEMYAEGLEKRKEKKVRDRRQKKIRNLTALASFLS